MLVYISNEAPLKIESMIRYKWKTDLSRTYNSSTSIIILSMSSIPIYNYEIYFFSYLPIILDKSAIL